MSDLKPENQEKKYTIIIDGKDYTVFKSIMLGKEILGLARLDWQRYDLQKKFKDGSRKIVGPDEEVDFSKCEEVERFETIPREAQQG